MLNNCQIILKHYSLRDFAVIILCIVILLTACGKKTIIKKIDYKILLVQALRSHDEALINSYLTKVRLTENSQNIIDLYLKLSSANLLTLNQSINYLAQFYPNMNLVHQSIYDRMATWVYLKEIYRQEISPPVRILQREKLLLAPSNIDFKACNSHAVKIKCAYKQRSILMTHMSDNQINNKLRAMALNDPCVNLSNKPQGQKIANSCLMKSTGDLKVELLPAPQFSNTKWLQALNE